MLLESWQSLSCFDALRYPGDALKAGILPFYFPKEGMPKFLVAAPKPVRRADDVVPFAIARGSRRMKQGEAWVDIRDQKALAAALAEKKEIEPLLETALSEAEEELGLSRENIAMLYDCGALAYKDYGIHCFAALVKDAKRLKAARDSRDVRWITWEEAVAMAEAGTFNRGYLPLLESVARALAAL